METYVWSPDLIGKPSSFIEGYTGEPFDGVDGHFVGSDGFVVPRNFSEFLETSPDYVTKWVSRKLKLRRDDPDVQDWTQTLLMHLCQLPTGREVVDEDTDEVKIVGGKFSQLGFCDVISVFNPWAHFGASAKRFYNYINRCLTNKFLSLTTKAMKDATSHKAILPDNDDSDDSTTGYTRDYMLMERSSVYNEEVSRGVGLTFQQIFVQQFRSFLERKNPELLKLADAIMYKDKIEEILLELDIDHNEFLRSRKKLIKLSKSFAGTH